MLISPLSHASWLDYCEVYLCKKKKKFTKMLANLTNSIGEEYSTLESLLCECDRSPLLCRVLQGICLNILISVLNNVMRIKSCSASASKSSISCRY